VQGSIAQGMGALAVGAGQYNQQTAVARSINANTAMQWNQYMYLSQQEANRREYLRMARRQRRDSTSGDLVHKRLLENPTAEDSADGDALNVNADSVAGAVAAAVGAAKLVYLTNVEGLYTDFGDRGSLVSEIKASELWSLLPTLSEGMRPKAASALSALEGGVGKVHVLDGRIRHALLLEIFTDEGIGTQVLA